MTRCFWIIIYISRSWVWFIELLQNYVILFLCYWFSHFYYCKLIINFVLSLIIHCLRKVLERIVDWNVSLCCVNCYLRYYHDDEDVINDKEFQRYLDNLSTNGKGIGRVSTKSPMRFYWSYCCCFLCFCFLNYNVFVRNS